MVRPSGLDLLRAPGLGAFNFFGQLAVKLRERHGLVLDKPVDVTHRLFHFSLVPA